MMRTKGFAPVMRGIAAIMACVLVLTIVGAGVADSFRARIDGALPLAEGGNVALFGLAAYAPYPTPPAI